MIFCVYQIKVLIAFSGHYSAHIITPGARGHWGAIMAFRDICISESRGRDDNAENDNNKNIFHDLFNYFNV